MLSKQITIFFLLTIGQTLCNEDLDEESLQLVEPDSYPDKIINLNLLKNIIDLDDASALVIEEFNSTATLKHMNYESEGNILFGLAIRVERELQPFDFYADGQLTDLGNSQQIAISGKVKKALIAVEVEVAPNKKQAISEVRIYFEDEIQFQRFEMEKSSDEEEESDLIDSITTEKKELIKKTILLTMRLTIEEQLQAEGDERVGEMKTLMEKLLSFVGNS